MSHHGPSPATERRKCAVVELTVPHHIDDPVVPAEGAFGSDEAPGVAAVAGGNWCKGVAPHAIEAVSEAVDARSR